MSAAAVVDATLVTRTADAVGRQSVVVVLDVRKKTGLFAKGYEVFTHNGKKSTKTDPFELAQAMQAAGAGEIVINSIDRDGQMKGYDLALAARMRQELRIPLTFLGGAGSHQDIEALLGECGVVGASVGSLFVFKGPYRAVLINYPNPEQKDRICRSGLAMYSSK